MKPIIEFKKQDISDDEKEILKEALLRFASCQEREGRSRDLAIRDKVFVESEGGAWADSGIDFTSNNIDGSATSTTAPEPPRYQIDRVTPVLEQALSDQRENEIQIQVRGKHQGNKAIDETMNGLIKNVEASSDASYSYDNAFDETQKCGYGGWQIVTEYADDSFDQDIRIRPVKDAASSLWFGPSDLYTKEDAPYAFVIWYEDIDEYKAQYPDSSLVDVPNDTIKSNINLDWYDSSTNMIRLAAYWRKRPVKREIVRMTDGKTYDVTEEFKSVQDELRAQGIEIDTDANGKEMRRTVDAYEIERFIINGAEVLKGPQKWLGKYFPLVPEYGVTSTVQGRELVRGRVRKTIDSSMVYNFAISGAAKQAATSRQDLIAITSEQADGYVDDIEKLNVSDAAAMIYNHVEGQTVPFVLQGGTISPALVGLSQIMAENIAATVGGNVGMAVDGTSADGRSGEAILQGQAVSEKGNAIYMANHVRSVAYCGKILADLLPRLKTGESQERIVKPDGSTEFVAINKTELDEASGEEVILNDLSSVKYDVVPDVGPAYASKRQQASAQLQELAKTNPAFASRPDLILKGVELGDGNEMYQSLRKELVLSGQVEPTDDEREEFKIDQVEQIKQQLIPQLTEQLTQDANIRMINANAAALEAQAQATAARPETDQIKAMADLIKQETQAQAQAVKNITESFSGFKTQLEALQKQAELGIPMSLQDHDNLVTQSEVVEEVQQDIQQGPNQEQLEDFNNVTQNLE